MDRLIDTPKGLDSPKRLTTLALRLSYLLHKVFEDKDDSEAKKLNASFSATHFHIYGDYSLKKLEDLNSKYKIINREIQIYLQKYPPEYIEKLISKVLAEEKKRYSGSLSNWSESVKRDIKGIRSEYLAVLDNQDNDTLAIWSNTLNCWGWPEELPNLDDYKDQDLHQLKRDGENLDQFDKIIDWIYVQVGGELISRYGGNRYHFTDEEHSDWYRS